MTGYLVSLLMGLAVARFERPRWRLALRWYNEQIRNRRF
jgi:hypothetical protein